MKKSNRKLRIFLTFGGSLACLALLASSLLLFSPSFASQNASVPNAAQLESIQQSGEQKCLQPPENVNLMTLSDAQLAEYGLPPRVILDNQPAVWAAKLQHARHRTCGSTPDPRHIVSAPAMIHTPRVPDTPNAELTYTNWAGNIAYGNRGTYRLATLDMHVPRIPGIGTNQYVSIWSGVGGDSDFTTPNVLVQAGVQVQRAGSPFGGQYNTSWWEVYPYNAEQDLPLSRLDAGDEIFISVSSNFGGDGYDYFYIQNVTANSYNTHYDYNHSHFSDSAVGECIVERPTIGKSLPSLANFGTQHLSQCDIGSDSQFKGIKSWPHDYAVMIDDSGNTLATVGAISGTDVFSVYWKRYS
ncbi:MAG TPA: G1 family glutamic endopeptidase [Ktedonobacteraceae bacterium]|nr:G1 family glutamic endopeptidase [Ktedonobacteraceae bacterium]